VPGEVEGRHLPRGDHGYGSPYGDDDRAGQITVDDDAVPELVAERPAMVRALRERFPGCLATYLTREDDRSWLDVVLWRSREEAEDAARLVGSVPTCAAWFRHIVGSGGLRHVEVVDAWPGNGRVA
jgi:hypothetical protein